MSSLLCIQNQPLLLLLAFQVLFYNLSLRDNIISFSELKKGPLVFMITSLNSLAGETRKAQIPFSYRKK